jgi:hypothetical protein
MRAKLGTEANEDPSVPQASRVMQGREASKGHPVILEKVARFAVCRTRREDSKHEVALSDSVHVE